MRSSALSRRADERDPAGVNPLGQDGASRNGAVYPGDDVSQLLRSTILGLVSTERESRHEPAGLVGGFSHPTQGASAFDGASQDASPSQDPFECLDGPIPAWKRLLDVGCIAITAPIWLPLMLLIAAWIKLVSPGPIFYRQERVGYRRRPFMMLKFRTMHVNVDTEVHEMYFERLIDSDTPMTKLDSTGDPRLIRCGRLLRAAGLDEFPQLFNVLRGEMSLVGPRPCTPREFSCYLAHQHARFNAPPGMTGYWQVNGKNKTTFTQMIAMDIFYTENMSVVRDMSIILKTPLAVLAQVAEPASAARARRRSDASRLRRGLQGFRRSGTSA
ncbi:MAG: sugar transferase [Chthoniobacterales bacterium]